MELVELEKVYRQTEPEFIALLNAIRNRSCTDKDLEKLNERHVPGFIPPDDAFCVTLTSTNDLAAARNAGEACLPSRAPLRSMTPCHRGIRPLLPSRRGNPAR